MPTALQQPGKALDLAPRSARLGLGAKLTPHSTAVELSSGELRLQAKLTRSAKARASMPGSTGIVKRQSADELSHTHKEEEQSQSDSDESDSRTSRFKKRRA